mgnify:CR=1 FL=1
MSGYAELKIIMETLKDTTARNTELLEQIKEDMGEVKGELNMQDLRIKILETSRNQSKIDLKWVIMTLIAIGSLFTSIYTITKTDYRKKEINKAL